MSRTLISMGALCALLMWGCPSDDEDDKDAGGSSGGGSSQGGNGQGDETSGGAGGDNNTTGDGVVDERCATVRCAGGTHCEVTEVDCINAPCEPTVQCVPDEGQVSCVVADCAPGYECILDPVTELPKCVSTKPEPACSLACEKGTHCEYVEVQCIQPPCDPVAECIADDACATVKCAAGKVCQLLYPPCAPPPDGGVNPNCAPQPVCVSGVPCGDAFCTGGQECCNASCGICVDPGMNCIQIAC